MMVGELTTVHGHQPPSCAQNDCDHLTPFQVVEVRCCCKGAASRNSQPEAECLGISPQPHGVSGHVELADQQYVIQESHKYVPPMSFQQVRRF